MDRIVLGNAGFDVSRLGYGCVGLTTLPREADALALLDRALDLGVTHYDTARAYGAGFSEEILGRFVKGRRDQITIATKFGLSPPAIVGSNRHLVRYAKKALSLFPPIDRMVRGRMSNPGATPAPQFTAANCVESLERSLTALGTDHVDFYFLHNGRAEDAHREDLVAAGERLVEQGKVRAFGVSSPITYLGDDLSGYSRAYSVFQCDYGTAESPPVAGAGDRPIFTFGVMTSLARLDAAIAADPARARRWSEAIDIDLSRPGAVASLLIRYTTAANPGGTVLVGTRSAGHLAEAVAAASAPLDEHQLARVRSVFDEALG